MQKVFVVGATGQARLCHQMLKALNLSAPLVFDRNPATVAPWADCEIFHDLDQIPIRAKECEAFIVCIGGSFGEHRTNYSRQLLALGLTPLSLRHPTAFVGATAVIGAALQMMPGSIINEFARVGDWCIVNTNASIDHDCRIGTGVHVMGAAAIAGEVEIGDFATIGTNATILPRLKIGRGAFVGAGAVVTKDVPDGVVVVGVPARAR